MTAAFFGLALLWHTAGAKTAEGADDLRGEWAGEHLELGGGKSLFDDLIKAVVVEMTSDEIIFNKRDPKNPYRVKYSLRQDKTPKQIDLTDPDGRVLQGIYKLEDDVLTICSANYPD